jgi:hypothetical protein
MLNSRYLAQLLVPYQTHRRQGILICHCINLQVLAFIILAATHCILNAQHTDKNIIVQLNSLVTESYGPDQHLINGIESVNLHLRSEGHKFLGEDKYYPGRVVIDGQVYHDVSLKYDIFNQRLLLLVQHQSAGPKQIILNNLRINEFEINGRTFRKYTFPGSGTRFYQVMGSDEMACLYHFSKLENLNPVDRYTLSRFTDERKKSYLYWHTDLHEFKSARLFVRIFPDHQPEIKAFIRKNNFRFRNINDSQMLSLISYCNSLRENPPEE